MLMKKNCKLMIAKCKFEICSDHFAIRNTCYFQQAGRNGDRYSLSAILDSLLP